MNNPQRSPESTKVATRRNAPRRGSGCLLAFTVVLIGAVAALAVWGPRLLEQFAGPLGAPPFTLQASPSAQALATRRAQEAAQLNSYGWVNQPAGIAHIPIDRAIALLAEQGLPVGEPNQPTLATTSTLTTTAATPADLANVNYVDDVLPIFEQHCSECHGADDPEEQLELTRYRSAIVGSQNGPVIVPGDPDASYLVEMVVSGQMPKRGDPLSQSEIDTIIAWIKAGAPEN